MFQAANPGCLLEDFVRWYSPRDWIECNETPASHDHSSVSHDHSSPSHDHSSPSHDHSSPSHDQLCSEDNNDTLQHSTVTKDNVTGDVVTDNNTTDDVTNNNTTNDVTKNSDMSGWDEDWAEVEPSNAPSVTHRVGNHITVMYTQ